MGGGGGGAFVALGRRQVTLCSTCVALRFPGKCLRGNVVALVALVHPLKGAGSNGERRSEGVITGKCPMTQ